MSAAAGYTVAAELLFNSNAAQTFPKIIEGLERIQTASEKASENLAKFADSVKALDGLQRAIGRISTSMRQLGESDLTAGLTKIDQMSTAMGGLATKQDSLAISAKETAESWEQAARAMSQASRLPMGRASGGSVAGAASVARAAGAHAHGLNSMEVSIAADTAAEGAISVAEKAAHAAMEPAYYASLMAANEQNSPDQVEAAKKGAWDATRSAPGSTYGGNMEAIFDVSNITGSLEEATKIAPQFAELTQVLRAATLHGGGSDDPALAAAKSLEILGRLAEEKQGADGKMHRVISTDKLTEYTEALARIAVKFGDTVSPETYLSMAKQARVGGMQEDDRFMFHQLPAVLSVLGGPRTGTMLNSMNSVFFGGHMTSKTMDAMQASGLADAGGVKIEKGRDGKKKEVVHPEAIHHYELMRTNTVEWVRLITQEMEAAGKTKNQILSALQAAGQRATIGGGWADIYAGLPTIDKDEKGLDNTLKDKHDGTNPMNSFTGANPVGNIQQFQGALTNLMAAFGESVFPQAIGLMNSLTAGLNAVGDWAKANPDEARKLTETAAAMGVFAAAVGVISTAMLIYGPIARAVGLGGLAKGAWSGLKTGAVAIGEDAGFMATSLAKGALSTLGLGALGVAGNMLIPSQMGTGDTMPAATLQGYMAERRGSSVPPPPSQPTKGGAGEPLHVVVDNGRDLARGVTAAQTRAGSSAATGATGYDVRSSPMQPGAGGLN